MSHTSALITNTTVCWSQKLRATTMREPDFNRKTAPFAICGRVEPPQSIVVPRLFHAYDGGERLLMQGTMMNCPLTLTHILERAGRIFPEREIVSRLPDHSLHRCTYADVYRRSRRLAEALQKAGLRRGDRVATLMWNHYAHVEAYMGIPTCGGVMHTLNLRLAPREIAYVANHGGGRFLIV